MTNVIDDVMAERRRQIDEEGHTLEQDVAVNRPGQLALAAAAYTAQVGTLMMRGSDSVAGAQPPSLWPFPEESYKQKGFRSSLIKAAAMLVAEVERLDLAAQATTSSN